MHGLCVLLHMPAPLPRVIMSSRLNRALLQLPYIKPSWATSIQGFNATHAEDQKPGCSKHSQPIGHENRIIPPFALSAK